MILLKTFKRQIFCLRGVSGSFPDSRPEKLNEPPQKAPFDANKDALSFDEAVVLGKREIGIEGGKAGPGRGNKTGSNITRLPRGTSETYTVARLRRDRPDLAQLVKDGALSAHAAAIEAGFRKATWNVRKTC